MLVVHHLNNSRSQRILWLLEELGLNYEIRPHQRDARLLAPKSLRDVHPLGKSPVLEDDGRQIAESGAIIEYVLDRFGRERLRPAPGTPEFDLYRYFLHYAEGSAMPPLVMKLVFEKIPEQKMPFFAKPIAKVISQKALATFLDPEIRRHATFLEGELSARPWFAGGEFSAADIQMSFPVEAMESRTSVKFDQTYPHLRGYLDRIRARPAYRRALERGGPFEITK